MIGLGFIIVVLFTFAYIRGTELKAQNEEKNDEEQSISLSDIKGDPEKSNSDETVMMDDIAEEADIYGNEPLSEDDELDVNKLEDFFSQEQITKATEVAESFVEAFYPYNGDRPAQHIEQASHLMSEGLYEERIQSLPRPTVDVFKKELVSISSYEPYDPNDKTMNLSVRAKGKVFNADGELTNEELVEYDLILTKKMDSFVVKSYGFVSLN
ncbi:hypothetical protein H0266_18180 [Halobacillus locisalis]|uniref:Uncharacterized protein n=1 Tax=Halobacillus locisalis TaxID=220753 RepID=A0A838CXY7_9BACI|nr:hypothetical protein [Halobacillus locisalis]MBA2176810.1 hypothetical protein [Halobacillus locisalis]